MKQAGHKPEQMLSPLPQNQEDLIPQLATSTVGNGSHRAPGLADAAFPKSATQRSCYFSHASLDSKYVSGFMRIRDITGSSHSQLSCLHTKVIHLHQALFALLAVAAFRSPSTYRLGVVLSQEKKLT